MSVAVDTPAVPFPITGAARTPDALLQAVIEQQRVIDRQAELVEDNTRVIANQQARIAVLEEQLRLERHRRFGASSETNVLQGDLAFEGGEAPLEDGDADPDAADTTPDAEPPRKKRRGRKKGLSPDLPRVERRHLLSDAEREGAIETFFVKVKEELDIVPARVQVIEHWQEKAVYLDADGERALVAAARPAHPIGKGIASTNLLAWIAVSKFADGLPLNAIETILARYGGEITRTTLASWMIALHLRLAPLVGRLERELLGGDYLQGDETRLKVMKEPGTAPTATKWLWVMRGGPPGRMVVRFEYDKSRGGAVAERLLEHFSGRYFQSDGYAGYDEPCRAKGIVHLGCFDHARRKVVEAIRAQPKPASGKPSKAMVMLSKIDALYRLERVEFAGLDDDERFEARQTHAVPKLAALKVWLETNAPKVAKGSLTRRAMDYTLNQWEKLVRYTEHGQLRMSNVLAENAIRPLAIGRKRWLFADTPEGARAVATYFTLIESAKANGVEPLAYLQHVFANIAAADTDEALDALLPWNVS